MMSSAVLIVLARVVMTGRQAGVKSAQILAVKWKKTKNKHSLDIF